MPFDGKDFNRPDLSVPTLEGLSWLLRHREAWPEDFEWDYGSCDDCAMGLAECLWSIGAPDDDASQFEIVAWVGDMLDVPNDIAHRLFLSMGDELDIDHEFITPEHVALAIDAYLAKQP